MKELNLLTEWADSIVNEFDGSNVKQSAKKQRDPLAGDKDIARQASTKYAGRDKDQALELFIADKLEDMEKRDLEQNKVINAQRRENDKLRKELTTLGQEVNDVVDTSKQDHNEIERIRALAGQAKTDAETRRVGRDEVESLVKQVAELRDKPNTDPESVIALQKEIKALSEKESIDPQKFEEFKNRLEQISTQKSVDKADFERLQSMISKAEQAQSEVERGRNDVNAKIADIERRQAEVEKKEKEHNTKVNDVVNKTRKKMTDITNSVKNRIGKVSKRVDKLEPEVDEQEITNIQQDTKLGDQEAALINQQSAIEYLIKGIGRQKYTVKDNHKNKRDISDAPQVSPVNDPLDNDDPRSPRKKINNSYDWLTHFQKSVNTTFGRKLSNLLSTHSPVGEKSKNHQESDIKKARILIDNFKTAITKTAVNNFADNSEQGQLMRLKFVNTALDSLRSAVLVKSAKAGIPMEYLWTGDGELPKSRRLPESLNVDLNNLAESILGPQYAKYLK